MPPNERIRRTITIYTRWTNPVTGLTKPFRRVLTQVHIEESSNTVARQTGNILAQSRFFQVFNQPNLEYVPLHVWRNLSENDLSGRWSIDDRPSMQSIVVDHESDVEIDWGTLQQVTNDENRHFITVQTAIPGASRVTRVEPAMRGSPRAQHITLRT